MIPKIETAIGIREKVTFINLKTRKLKLIQVNLPKTYVWHEKKTIVNIK